MRAGFHADGRTRPHKRRQGQVQGGAGHRASRQGGTYLWASACSITRPHAGHFGEERVVWLRQTRGKTGETDEGNSIDTFLLTRLWARNGEPFRATAGVAAVCVG